MLAAESLRWPRQGGLRAPLALLQVKQVEAGTVHFRFSLSPEERLDSPAVHTQAPRSEPRPCKRPPTPASPPTGEPTHSWGWVPKHVAV